MKKKKIKKKSITNKTTYLPKANRNSYLPVHVSISKDTFQLYLEDIKIEPMLTKEKELELGRKIKYGEPSDKQGALNRLIKSNLRFVVKIALHYDKERKIITDLINEGNIGLIKAANKFDPDRELKFISYAVWWIRQHILHYIITHQHLVSIPFNRAGKLRKVIKESRQKGMDIEKGSDSVKEIAKKLNVKSKDIEEAYEYAQKDISLDSKMESGLGESMLGFYPSPEVFYVKKAEMTEITKLMKILNKREQYILKLYFGLGDNTPTSFEKIGDKLGISRERVRQIKERALQKIRQSPDTIKLQELVGG